ncbi:glutamate receptor 4 [Penaeus vannamei]|uniref:glutamate receptor 4 n=1 Tax=Penaeus vannamei TaxID=6689 RepID=UPI00387FAA20
MQWNQRLNPLKYHVQAHSLTLAKIFLVFILGNWYRGQGRGPGKGASCRAREGERSDVDGTGIAMNEIWFLLLATLVVVALDLLATHLLRDRVHARFGNPEGQQGPGEAQAGAKQTVQGHLWSSAYLTLALLLGQSVPRLPSASALRVMAGVWLLSALIVSSVYRSNLKAMLILPKLRLPFDSMDELLEANIPTYVADGTMLYQKMMVSPPDSFLGRLRAQTVTYLDTPRAIRELLLGRHATFASRAIGQSVIHQIFEQTKTCPLYTAKERFWGATSVALAFPKGSPLKPKIDKILRRLTEFGIPEHLHQKQIRHERKCQMDDFTRPSDALRPLALGDFYGVFIVYVGGVLLSLLAFLIELLLRRRARGARP